ncbi:MAG TPA: hypothetical protein VN654_06285 [Vicinamibacterales bacterium]|nr:hypothetical protein [Vicinamibacterales bacterium]
MINDTTAGRWLKRVIWLGIFANLALALPTLAAPDFMMDRVGLPTATPLLWPRFAGLLLIILSVFYTPAATDLDRYRIVAWFAIASRAAGVLFFVPQATYRMLGLFDLVFLVPELLLLLVAINGATGTLTAKPAGARA